MMEYIWYLGTFQTGTFTYKGMMLIVAVQVF